MKFQKGHKSISGSFGKGSKHTEATKNKLSKKLKGRKGFWTGKKRPGVVWNKGLKIQTNTGRTQFKKGEVSKEKHPGWKGGKPNCLDCGKKLSTYKVKRCVKCSGKKKIGTNHPCWVDDRNKLKKSEKKHLDTKYHYWMLEVKKRDSWKCRLLSCDCKGRLESHHIFNWIEYPELRYVINNGITLCAFHHPRGREEEKRMIPIFQELLSVSKDNI